MGVGDDDVALNNLIEKQTDNVLITEIREYKERLERLELENQKRSRMTEAEMTEKQREDTKQEKQIKFYKNLAFGVSLVLLVTANVLLGLYLWGHLNKVLKGFVLLIDTGLLIFILRIRWKLSTSIVIGIGVIGFIASILQIVDL